MPSLERRYDLDWLRVLLFALLVPHHAAVGFVSWGAEIYGFANDRLAGEGLGLFIYFSHSWRLPSLFLIAGIGTWFATRAGIGLPFLGSRVARLMVPALFGTFALNVFGGYAIARTVGDPPGFLAFWYDWITDPVPRQVQHLWFLFNLTAYTLACWPLFLIMRRFGAPPVSAPWLLGGLAALSALIVAVAKPHAAALAGDAYQWPYYLSIFAGGYIIGSRHRDILAFLERNAGRMLLAASLAFGLKLGILSTELARDAEAGAALAAGGWAARGIAPAAEPLYGLFSISEAVTAWTWCLAALGLGARFLRRPGPLLRTLTRAVFPVYVLHFPVTLVGLALLAQIGWPWPAEFLLLTLGTYAVTWTLFLLADRLGPAIYLVGGRPWPTRPA